MLSLNSAVAETPAFPGAQGFGATATGGRGGPVYHVTTLGDSGAGSLRDAASQPGRTIIFDVGGCINLSSELRVAGDTTIAGQTAPGGGIAIYGQPVSLSNAKNIILRHLRIRQGVNSNPKKSALMMSQSSGILLDHCSIEWGRWDTVDMGEGANITLQNCIIGEGISPQRFGCLCQSDYVTFSHDLWISNHSRNPKAKGHVQYIDNVLYNYGIGLVGGHSAADHFDDVINNYFIKGPSSGSSFTGEFTATDKVFQSGNFADLDRDGQLNGRPVAAGEFVNATIVPAPFFKPVFPVTVDDARSAVRIALSTVGASLLRDAVDTRLISELASFGASGKVISDPAEAGGPGQISGGEAPKDSDGDGLPDYWELATGSDPKVADSNKSAASGYTLLEEYLNWLAGPHAILAKDSALEIDLRSITAGFNDASPGFTVTNAFHGNVTLLPDGHTARFTPAPDFIGRAGFDFTVAGNDHTSMAGSFGLLVTKP
jgi:pectate lyase